MLSPKVVVADREQPPLVLVLGGQRSGKSRWAEQRVLASGLAPVYLATAEPGDGEMALRIRQHQARREASWQLVEEPLDLAGALRQATASDRAVLVDCLTLWLANLLGANADLDVATAELASALEERHGPVVLVSNEVGSGVIPMNALARRFVDEAGSLHQRLAARASEVMLVTAGIAQSLKAHAPGP